MRTCFLELRCFRGYSVYRGILLGFLLLYLIEVKESWPELLLIHLIPPALNVELIEVNTIYLLLHVILSRSLRTRDRPLICQRSAVIHFHLVVFVRTRHWSLRDIPQTSESEVTTCSNCFNEYLLAMSKEIRFQSDSLDSRSKLT